MFPVSKEALGLFSKNYRQTAEIIFRGTDREFTITEKNIMLGGLTVDRYSVSGDKIEIGSACASELALTLDNREGQFEGVRFEGAELFVRIGIKKYDARRWENATIQYVPLGYFTIDEPARALQTISLSALDRMVLFDKPVDWSTIAFPITVKDILSQACNICNVPLETNITGRPNWNYVIQSAPEDETTYRQIVQWVAELTATCAFIDWDGRLRLSWYEPSTVQILPSDRYSSDMLENDITISGVQVVDDDSNVYANGDDSYVFRIEGNSFVQHDYQAVCDAIYDEVGGFTYRPYECVTKPMPYLYPMDMVEYVDKDGVSHNTIVTNTTFTMNGNTAVMGKGETETSGSYASANPLTKQEDTVIKAIKKSLNETLNSSVQSILAFNDLITNSLGVYTTITPEPDGSKKYYMHDRPTLEESNTIYTMVDGGFAYTNGGWNDGNPVWEYGLDKYGNAIFNTVSAYGMEVSDPNSAYRNTITPEAFRLWRNSTMFLEAAVDGLKIYDGAITLYNGTGADAKKVLFFDDNGNIAMDGYLTQEGSKYKALVGLNDKGYGGFYVYNEDWEYLDKTDYITLKPYFEVWRSTDYNTFIKGYNKLCLMTTNASDPNDSNHAFLTGHQEHGYAKVAIHNYDLRWGTTIVVDATDVGGVWWEDNNMVYLGLNGTHAWGVGVGGYYRIVANATGGHLYGTWTASNSIGVTSDADKKNSIEELPEKYTALFDNLKPVRYKYNDGTSDRYHTGFIAQDVEQALADSGIDSKDFAGFIKDENGDCFLRYEEFIALAVNEIQSLKKKNSDLENRVAELESKIGTLESKLDTLVCKFETLASKEA